MTGQVYAVVGPSGVGKDTLLAGAVARGAGLHWARRVITRPEVAGGEPFEGVDAATFAARQALGVFALHWQAHGLSYGIPFEEFSKGERVVFNGSRAALPAACALFPALVVIRISAPSRVLTERLLARGRETNAQIDARLRRASYDLPQGLPVVDVVNDGTPEEGIQRLLQALSQPVSA